MWNLYKKLLAFFLIFCGLAQCSMFAAASVTTTAADELVRLLGEIHTLRATFAQSLTNHRQVPLGPKTTGSMVLERPGKFRWEVLAPHQQLIIVSGEKMLSYDAELSQVVKRKVDYQRAGNPAMLLSGSMQSLVRSFVITKLKNHGQGIWFKLMPRGKRNQEGDYQWIELGFVGEKLQTMQIVDNLDQRSVINFGNLVINAKISPQSFIFTPPPNTEVFNAE